MLMNAAYYTGNVAYAERPIVSVAGLEHGYYTLNSAWRYQLA